MNMHRIIWIFAVIAGHTVTGCATRGSPAGPKPYTTADLERLRATAKDPRIFFMNAYPEESGDIVFTNANRLYQELKVTLPFASPVNTVLPLLSLLAGPTRPVSALTDTSAPLSWVPLDRRRAMGFETLGPELNLAQAEQVIDDVPGVAAVLPELRFGDLRMEMVLVYARAATGPLWPVTRDPRTANANLVIGTNILRAFAWVQWDFPNRRIHFSSAGAYEGAEEDRLASLPLSSATGPLIVNGEIEGRPRPILLDVAGDFEMVMDAPPADVVRHVTLGDLVFRRLAVSTPRSVGVAGGPARLGLRALAPYRLTLDNRRKLAYIERAVVAHEHEGEDEEDDNFDAMDGTE